MLSILRAATDEFGQTVVIVTHDPRAASYADRVVFLADGKIVRELPRPTADDVFEVMKNLDDVPAGDSGSDAGATADVTVGAELGKHESGSVAPESGVGRHAADAGSGADSTQAG